MDSFAREGRDIEKAYDDGEIDAQQRDFELRELHRDYRAQAEEESQRVYDDKMNEFYGG